MDIGGNLKAIRKTHGLSQRELAKRAGVTNSTISMIEKNSVSPSISSLEKVLAGIPVTLTEFFTSAQQLERQSPVVYRAADLTESSNQDGIVSKWIAAELPLRTLDLVDHQVPPHSPSHGMELPTIGDLAGIVIGGQLQLDCDQQTFVLETGDSFYLESDRSYRLSNPFDSPCRLITAASRTNV